MYGLRRGFVAAALRLLLACLGPLGIAAAVAGCATPDSEAPATRSVAQAGRVDLEEDGLPAQGPPSVRTRQQADDPAEPFSPNYGAPRGSGLTRVPVQLSSAEAEAIIARATLEHEMRRP